MKHRIARIAAIGAVAVAGLIAGLGTWPQTAQAWDWQNLPNGYTTIVSYDGAGCASVTLRSSAGTQTVGSTCDAGFQAALDAAVAATVCTVNPAAGQTQGLCLPPPTTTAVSTTTPVTTTVAATTTDAATIPVTTTDQTITAAPVSTSAGVTTTVIDIQTVQAAPTAALPTMTTDSSAIDDLTARVSALEQRQAVFEARLETIESQLGIIVGESKNEPPFTTATS